MKESINIVWLKRDLRTTDHFPLYESEIKLDFYIIIYLFEPNQTNYDDYSLRHKQFIYHSIIEMNKLLKKYNNLMKEPNYIQLNPVCNIFDEKKRNLYELEKLWGDGIINNYNSKK